MKRVFFLSWRQKFWLLIAATFIGLVLVALAALRGLDQVSESYEARATANTYENASLTLWSEWLKVENLSTGLGADEADDYQQLLGALGQQAEDLAGLTDAIADDHIRSTARDIEQQVAN
ncbi:MAG: methyl-accepting chemotaxis protein, partial [Marinobacter sp.]